ncbi:MAG: lipase maturation factor family protein [Bryobacteraceae bacterium]
MRTKPVLIYDGNCGFCRIWLNYWQALLGDSIDYVPSQELAAEDFPQLDREALKSAVYLLLPDGTTFRGAHAVFRSLAPVAVRYRLLLWLYESVGLFRAITDAIYGWIARHRDFGYHLTALTFGKTVRPHRFQVTEFLFLRALGITYAFAFGSLSTQILGLVGEHGILHAATTMQAMHQALGSSAYWDVPTLLWLSMSDQAMSWCCGLGIFFALMLAVNVLPRLSALLCFVLYLSIASVGQPFTLFQWDALLLEAGFLAIFSGLPWLVWVYRFLIFRLMFESGMVKLLSGDPNWENLHALRFHFMTQPLPNPVAWYVHHFQPWLLDSLTGWTLLIELVAPFLLFMPRRIRQVGAKFLIALQVCIALTGNYAYFNLLTLALLIWAFDDQSFEGIAKRLKWLRPSLPLTFWTRFKGLRVGAIAVLAVVVFLGATQVLSLSNRDLAWRLSAPLAWTAPFEVVNSYGLFAVMTTTRPEIVFEGSNDQQTWREYELPYKPGDLHRGLPVIAPLQPRLDWQLWFAALSGEQQDPWVGVLALRLLQGEPQVVRFFSKVPFQTPPRYIRAQRYLYTFTTRQERVQTGDIWNRSLIGPYLPTLSLEMFSAPDESK